MCRRVGAGEPTFQSPSVSEHSAAAPAATSAHSQLKAARLPMLLQDVVVGYHCCLRSSLFCRPHLASPLEPDELQVTDQVWDVAGGRGVADRYPKSDIRETVRFSQNLATYGWTEPIPITFVCAPRTG